MIRKILVYENSLADKHPALERALSFAKHFGAELKVVDVVEGPADLLHRPMLSLVEQERRDRLHAICERLREHHVPFTTQLIRGRPFVEIVREVVHTGAHLLIKRARGAARKGSGILGPVDLRLVRNCPCPVWLESPSRDDVSNRVLVAIDPRTSDNSLNRSLLSLGASVVKVTRGELQVVSVWHVPDEDFLADKMRSERLQRYTEDIRSAAKRSLDGLLLSVDSPPPNRVFFEKGDAARCILDLIDRVRPDVVILGSVGRTNVRGLLIGNTADPVLRQITRSSLAVKPPGLFSA